MSNALVKTPAQAALDKLTSAASKNSLDDLVKARTRRSMLLLDVSGSMNNLLISGGTKIDSLRSVVTALQEQHPVPVAAFGGELCAIVDAGAIPTPRGGTPLHKGIDFCRQQGATHLVLVSDGIADSQSRAFEAAKYFRGPIDVFYIGNGDDHGAAFARELAELTGGTVNLTDLGGEPKLLANKIAGYLGEGSAL